MVLPGKLWNSGKSDAGVDISNFWYDCHGSIITRALPAKATAKDVETSVLQFFTDRGNTIADTNGVAVKIGGQDAKMFMTEGPVLGSDKVFKGRLYIIIRGKVGYAIWLGLPKDTYDRDAGVLDSIMNSVKFSGP
jgi:hypothetical protein